MKKISTLVLSSLTAVFLVGCGGGSSTASPTASSTSVPVTKGTLINATAKDANGNIGTQVMENGKHTNKYSFTGDIAYPITVTDGTVDADNSGTITAGDYAFTGKLTSYSNVVTPITTYLGNPESTDYQTKLDKLKTLSGATEDDLVNKDPYELLNDNDKVFALSLSLYENYSELMDTDDNNDDITEDDDALETKINEYYDSVTGTTNKEDAYIAFENKLKTNLGESGYSEEEANVKKLEIENESKDLSSDTSTTGTTTSTVSGKSIIAYDAYGYVQANFYENGTYKEVGPDEDANGNLLGYTYTCTGKWLDFGNNKIGMTCENNGTSALPTGTAGGINDEVVITLPSSLTAGSTAEVEDDTETFDVTIMNISELANSGTITSDVAGKYLDVYDNYGSATVYFYADGSYKEDGIDIEEGPWTCTGKWLDFGNNKIAATCNDDDTKPDRIMNDNQIIFTYFSAPTNGGNIYAIDDMELFHLNVDVVGSISN